jgi:phosphotransferase system, enzyme I, PtsP
MNPDQPVAGGPPPDPSLAAATSPLAAAPDLSRSLGDLACAIGNQMQCDVCSIYRLDRQRQALVLSATVGLRQDCIERLRMDITEGLCGLVVQQRQPVSVAARAGEHPNFKFFPEAGEDPYESFLGVPVINGASIIGVLVVQTIEPHTFTGREIMSLAQAGLEMGPVLDQLRQQKETA